MTYNYTFIDMGVITVPSLKEAKESLEKAFHDSGLHVISKTEGLYPFPENAYTAAWILSESHVIVHTAPEDNWIEVVLATCSKAIDHEAFTNRVIEIFRPVRIATKSFEGAPPWEV